MKRGSSLNVGRVTLKRMGKANPVQITRPCRVLGIRRQDDLTNHSRRVRPVLDLSSPNVLLAKILSRRLTASDHRNDVTLRLLCNKVYTWLLSEPGSNRL